MTCWIPKAPSARRAFSLIEIMVVVAVIGILSTLLVLGVEKMVLNSRRQQTRAALVQCQAMFADWDTMTHQKFTPSIMPSPQNVADAVNPVPPMGPAQADDTKYGTRYGAAVWFTRDLMFNMRSTPNNAAALAKMSPGSLMTIPAVYTQFPAPYVVAAYNNTAPYRPFDSAHVFAQQYNRVYLTDSPVNPKTYTFYDSIQDSGSTGVTNAPIAPKPPGTLGYWLPSYPVTINNSAAVSPLDGTPTDNGVPVLLDGWGNPIIFVPGGTLGVSTDSAATDAYTLNMDGTVPPGTGGMASGTGSAALKTQARSPDGRPFFASAGPDGDFSKADDNMYSFEK